MKASKLRIEELRMGNYYLFDGEVEVIDRGFDFEELESLLTGSSEDLFSAAPLTEEWLTKFGINYSGVYHHFPNHSTFKLEQHKNKNSFWLIHGIERLDCVRINYVHQLQNLYFALTGEELTIID